MCGGRWAGQAESSCSRKSGTECVLPQPGECFISTLIPQILICRCMFGLNYSARETKRLPDYLPACHVEPKLPIPAGLASYHVHSHLHGLL